MEGRYGGGAGPPPAPPAAILPGVPTDPLRVYGALLPKAPVAGAHRAAVRVVDTVLLARGGGVWKWLTTSPAGEVVERVHADLLAVQDDFAAAAGLDAAGEGAAGAAAGGPLVMLVRRTSGAVELLRAEQAAAVFARWDDEAPTIVALQVRGGW